MGTVRIVQLKWVQSHHTNTFSHPAKAIASSLHCHQHDKIGSKQKDETSVGLH